MKSKHKVRFQPFHLRESACKRVEDNDNWKGNETELTVTNELNCTVAPIYISVIFVEEFTKKVKFSEFFFFGKTEYSQTINATDFNL